jgi:hypothetical protein
MRHTNSLPRTMAATAAAAAAALALMVAAAPGRAQAQAKLDASYAITVAHIPVGNVAATVDIGDGEYTMSMNGRASGMMRVLASGEGRFTTHGLVKDGLPVPESYSSKSTSDDDTLDVTMVLDGGAVQELTASPPPPSKDRVPLAAKHRHDIVDPLTALLLPASEGSDGLTQAACQRTLPVFDGRRRYDLKLAFKRMERVKADKGYAGPVVVCAVTFQPIAGHRASSPMVKYLGEGRAIEIAFAPVAGTKLLAPFRIAIANMLGNLVVQASRFEAQAPASVRASATTGPAAE